MAILIGHPDVRLGELNGIYFVYNMGMPKRLMKFDTVQKAFSEFEKRRKEAGDKRGARDGR